MRKKYKSYNLLQIDNSGSHFKSSFIYIYFSIVYRCYYISSNLDVQIHSKNKRLRVIVKTIFYYLLRKRKIYEYFNLYFRDKKKV